MIIYKSTTTKRRGDVTFRIGEIDVLDEQCQVQCQVRGCKNKDLYDIQAEIPECDSVTGGIFCRKHGNAIFNCFPASKFVEQYQEILLSMVPQEQKKLDEWKKKTSIYGVSD